MLGWRTFAAEVAAAADRIGARTLITHRRADAAELLYALRGSDLTVAVPLEPGARPRDHFQMTRPFGPDRPAPGLAISEGVVAPPPGAQASGPAEVVAVGRGVSKSRRMTLQPLSW